MAGEQPECPPTLYGTLASSCRLRQRRKGATGGLQLTAEWSYPPDYPGFSGHFPGHPVLPAVVQLAMVRYLAELGLGCPLQLESFSRIKFKGVVRPGETVVAEVELGEAELGWEAHFTLRRPAGEGVASGVARYRRLPGVE